MSKEIRLWAKLTKSAYCDVDKLPPHLVEVELDPEMFEKLIKERLDKLGIKYSQCKECKREILFLSTKTGKQMPTCLDFTSHFADCKMADKFRKKSNQLLT